MTDVEKVIKALSLCALQNAFVCDECPYHGVRPFCHSQLKYDALELLKKQNEIIEQYHKADGFLDAHGWKWNWLE